MGVSRLQGTSAFIERIGETKVRKYSCQNCKNYFDGICKVKNVSISYGGNTGSNCKKFDIINDTTNPNKQKKQKKPHLSIQGSTVADKLLKSNSPFVSTARNNYRNNKIWVIGRGNKVIAKNIKDDQDTLMFVVGHKNTDEDLSRRVSGKEIGSEFFYNDKIYKIINFG